MNVVSKETLGIEIPDEIDLKEDDDFFYLFHDDEQIVAFNKSNLDPQKIENFILDYTKYL
jgi:hypothetical protein